MIGELEQRLEWHRVDGERCLQCLDVEDIGSLGVLGAGAGPEQPLRTGAALSEASEPRRSQQFAVSAVGLLRYGDSEEVAQLGRDVARDGLVPSADEDGSYRADRKIQACRASALQPAKVRLSCGEVVFA